MSLVVARNFKLIFILLNSPKCDLGEFDETMFQEVAKHCEIIF